MARNNYDVLLITKTSYRSSSRSNTGPMSAKPSRTALVAWVNDILQLNVAKVDDLGTGAVYCQLIDSIYGDLPMSRVKFGSKSALDVEQNYKVLQQAFTKHRINRNIDTAKLMKCRLQDNLDFAHWLYSYWHETPRIPDYDPVLRRASSANNSLRSSASSLKLRNSMTDLSRQNSRVDSVMSSRRDLSRKSMSNLSNSPSTSSPYQPKITPSLPSRPSSSGLVADLQNQIRDLEADNEAISASVDVLIEERELYYNKLLDIESLVNEHLNAIYSTEGHNAGMSLSTDPLVILLRRVQEILFSSPEGFQPQVRPEDEPF